jgi:hypothetical protein
MTVRRRRPSWWFSRNELSGEPGAVHPRAGLRPLPNLPGEQVAPAKPTLVNSGAVQNGPNRSSVTGAASLHGRRARAGSEQAATVMRSAPADMHVAVIFNTPSEN